MSRRHDEAESGVTRTKTDEALAAAERTHADDPERAEILARARRFKASWVELAEGLTNARRGGHWLKWGYASFEEYAKKELHLRQETVDKLTGSFLFLQKRAPNVLTRDGVHENIPSYQAVDFLRRAEAREDAPRDVVQEIRKQVIDEGAAFPAVARQFRDVVFPVNDQERKERDAAALKGASTRLRGLLESTTAVPRKLASEVAQTVDRLLEALKTSEEEAA